MTHKYNKIPEITLIVNQLFLRTQKSTIHIVIKYKVIFSFT